MLAPEPSDRLFLLMTATVRQSARPGGDKDDKAIALLIARELIRRGHDPLPHLAAAMTLDVPE